MEKLPNWKSQVEKWRSQINDDVVYLGFFILSVLRISQPINYLDLVNVTKHLAQLRLGYRGLTEDLPNLWHLFQRLNMISWKLWKLADCTCSTITMHYAFTNNSMLLRLGSSRKKVTAVISSLEARPWNLGLISPRTKVATVRWYLSDRIDIWNIKRHGSTKG